MTSDTDLRAATAASSGSASSGSLAGAMRRNDRRSLAGMSLTVAALYVAGFGLLAAGIAALPAGTTAGHVFGWGTGLVALTLGIRHAFDADHIMAIDNTTRALAREDRRPASVGFFFALGHCSVVLALTIALCAGLASVSGEISDNGSALHQVTAVIGPAVSGVFMLLIGAFNARTSARGLRLLRRGTPEAARGPSGPLGRILAPVLRRVTRPAAMYPVGFLFGLGFDTATEVGLLVVSATAAVNGLPWWAVLALPLIFAAGMTTFDTADGILMRVVYGWALGDTRRTAVYNTTLTAVSAALALIVGVVQLGTVGAAHPGWLGRAGTLIGELNLDWLGYTAATGAVTLLAVLVWVRRRRRAADDAGPA